MAVLSLAFPELILIWYYRPSQFASPLPDLDLNWHYNFGECLGAPPVHG
jgi:hypothetical protein